MDGMPSAESSALNLTKITIRMHRRRNVHAHNMFSPFFLSTKNVKKRSDHEIVLKHLYLHFHPHENIPKHIPKQCSNSCTNSE